MQSSYTNLRVFPQHPDMQLRVAHRTFHVHREVLEAASIGFKALAEKASLKYDHVVYVLNVSAETTDMMLKYIYMSQEPPEDLDFDSLVNLYVATEDFKLEGLRDVCSERMVKALNLTNLPRAFQIANRFKSSYIRQKVVDYVVAQGPRVLEFEEMKKIERDNPMLLAEILKEIKKRFENPLVKETKVVRGVV